MQLSLEKKYFALNSYGDDYFCEKVKRFVKAIQFGILTVKFAPVWLQINCCVSGIWKYIFQFVCMKWCAYESSFTAKFSIFFNEIHRIPWKPHWIIMLIPLNHSFKAQTFDDFMLYKWLATWIVVYTAVNCSNTIK